MLGPSRFRLPPGWMKTHALALVPPEAAQVATSKAFATGLGVPVRQMQATCCRERHFSYLFIFPRASWTPHKTHLLFVAWNWFALALG